MSEYDEYIESWERRSVADGHAGLATLAEDGFDGVVRAGSATAYLLNGRIVGIEGGDIDSFEAASLTVHVAPEQPLPLLFAMRAGDPEPQGRYYTEETPIETVHDRLSEGGFTGYLELSENVLSGDYYLVYYGGQSLPVAFLGADRDRVLAGEEAYDRTIDEVGIYHVVPVDIAVSEVPTPPAVDATDDDPDTTVASDTDASDTAADEKPGDTSATPAAQHDDAPDAATDEDSAVAPDTEPSATATGDDTAPARAAAANESPSDLAEDTEQPATSVEDPSDTEATAATTADTAGDSEAAADTTPRPGDAIPADEAPPSAASTDDDQSSPTGPDDSAARDAAIERLQSRIDELEAELAAARDDTTTTDDSSGPSLSPADARARTTFLVRYEDRSRGTLADALDGSIDRDTLAANLRLEPHADFETATAVVDDRPYAAFIEDTLAYRIGRWLIGDLGPAILAADAAAELADIVEALPAIDRLALDASIDVDAEGADAVSFDIVCRSRHGDPLVVIDHATTHDAIGSAPVATLLENATTVADGTDTLAAALYVTESYYGPAAIETVEEATAGGLLSRSAKASYVKAARNGFHCCLAEARDDTVRLTEPEL
jgi:hypothetical protein